MPLIQPMSQCKKAIQMVDASYTVSFDQCRYGLVVNGERRTKRTRLIGNLDLSALARNCDHHVAHPPLTQGTAKLAAAYPKRMCTAMVKVAQTAYSGGVPMRFLEVFAGSAHLTARAKKFETYPMFFKNTIHKVTGSLNF